MTPKKPKSPSQADLDALFSAAPTMSKAAIASLVNIPLEATLTRYHLKLTVGQSAWNGITEYHVHELYSVEDGNKVIMGHFSRLHVDKDIFIRMLHSMEEPFSLSIEIKNKTPLPDLCVCYKVWLDDEGDIRGCYYSGKDFKSQKRLDLGAPFASRPACHDFLYQAIFAHIQRAFVQVIFGESE
jgi:hypothetical protein